MIGRIHGEVVEKGTESVIVDVNGVGYEIAVTAVDFDDLKLSEPATLYTYLHVRENAQDLFGFKEAETKKLFEMLIGVSGVGPKGAMAILGLGDQRQVRQAIAASDTAYISGAAGVGKKVAEKVTIDLKDKVGVMAGQVVETLEGEVSGDDAVDALVSLGYNKSQAMGALAKVDPKLKTEERIKAALKDL